MKVISIINQKGGIGKTTNTIHLGAYLANSGNRVLLIDFDPQCDLSHGVGFDVDEMDYDIVDFLNNKDGFEASGVDDNLFAITGNKRFIPSKFNRSKLRKQLQKLESYFDYVLIDCPPTTINFVDVVAGDLALVASDYFLVPIEADEYPIKNLNDFLGSVFKLKDEYNSKLKFLGVFFSNILVTKMDHEYYLNLLKETGIEQYIFKSYIRQDTNIQKAVRNGETIFTFKPKCRAAKDFEELTEELIDKIKEVE